MRDRYTIRPIIPCAAILALLALATILVVTSVGAAPGDMVADQVFGQPGFTSNTANNGGVSASSLNIPGDVAVDANGNVYVADASNNRVLEYNDPLTTDAVADRVFGQPDFTSNAANNATASATSLFGPEGVGIDADGNLYVADQSNHRVVVYNDPLNTDAVADLVFGQPDFAGNAPNNGGVSASSLSGVTGVAFDAAGNLYLVDTNNHRVLVYNDPLTTDTVADRVIGQPNFTSNDVNNGGLNASSLRSPYGVAVDAVGNLYIGDYQNRRVLQYNDPLNTDAVADRVFGQPDFNSDIQNNGGISASTLRGPDGVAIDAAGNLYIADFDNSRVLEYDSPLTTDTVADRVIGQPDFTSNTANNGGISAGSLNGPYGLAIDGAGNLYVGDYTDNRVLRYENPLALDIWGDSDCSGAIGARDNQALLRNVLAQGVLSQTEPCPDLVETVGGRIWGDWDCDGAIKARDNQALLRFVLGQPALGQTEPCPDVGTTS